MKSIILKKNFLLVVLFLFSINTIGISQTNDFDNDGIADITDIDDDNDGITDYDENGPICSTIYSIRDRGASYTNYNFYSNHITNNIAHLNNIAYNSFSLTTYNEGTAKFLNSKGVQIRSYFWNEYIRIVTSKAKSFETSGNKTISILEFNSPVNNLEFTISGINKDNGVTVNAYSNGVAISLNSSNFTILDFETGDMQINANTISNSSNDKSNPGYGYDNSVKILIPNTIDSLVIYSGKTANNNGNIIIGLHSFSFCTLGEIDTDHDGYPNHQDLDSDNDGIADIIEAGGIDTDFNGITDNFTDTDFNGLSDNYQPSNTFSLFSSNNNTETSILSTTSKTDTDNDGISNYLDLDSDDDGCYDLWEAYTEIHSIDSDLDGIYGEFHPMVENNGLVSGLNYNTGLVETIINSNVSICTGIDYGDAPDSYGSRAQNNGAYHGVNDLNSNVSPIMLGNKIDVEYNASNDDNINGYSDEDAFTSFPSLTTSTNTYTIWVPITYNNSKNELSFTVAAWIDFNQDGDFNDAGEKASRTINSSSLIGNTIADDINSNNEVRLTWNSLSPTSGNTYIRIRIASDQNDVINPNGLANDGEVEDYGLRVDDVTPIELLSFNGECDTYNTVITWSTATEENNNYFTLEKSYDLNYWEKVANIDGAGNSNEILNYSYQDTKNSETVYYRLTQTDFDGKYEVFSPISINPCLDVLEEKEMSIYPNPAIDNVNIELIGSENNTHYQIYIYNSYGAVVYSGTYTSKTNINISNLEKGIYIVKLINNNETYNKSLIIN